MRVIVAILDILLLVAGRWVERIAIPIGPTRHQQ